MKLTIYRIFSFLLLPVAVLFGISILLIAGVAFSNPAMLLPLFLFLCIVIYSFAALNFLVKAIDGGKTLSNTSKDWLKVNAFVSLAFAVLLIIQCSIVLAHPEMMQQLAAQTRQMAVTALQVNDATLENLFRASCIFFLIYAIVLLVHVLISLQYVKQYNYLFQKKQQ